MPTQLERALKVVANFVPKDKPGKHYVYAYLGKASYDATKYEIINGLCLASKRIWHLDENQTDRVAYVGNGNNERINNHFGHPFIPVNSECRIKLYKGSSKSDAQELERLLIIELGCILDNARDDGCLANIILGYGGPFCCKWLEATFYKHRISQPDVTAAAIKATSITTYAIESDKTILAEGSMNELSRQLNIDLATISNCCANRASGIWSKQLSQPLYFCKAEDYDSYSIKPMSTKQFSRHRVLIAAKLDGSDICCGSAAEIKSYAPEITLSGRLHEIAQGKRSSAYGWRAVYADEPEAPATTCGPSLSEFF